MEEYGKEDCMSRGLYRIERQELAMRLGKEGGSVAALLRNQLTF